MRRLLGNLAVALATIVFLLMVLEAATRLLARVGPTLIVKDPKIGKRYVPGFSGGVYVPEARREVRLRFDRDGFRGPDRPHVPAPGVRRVVVLGDSMTVAVATDEERTFVRLLEERLNAAGQERWEVLSFGVSSASTGQELVVYREVASRYHPDVVVCAFYAGNDLADNSVRLTRAPRLYFDLDARGELTLQSTGPGPSPIADWLDQHSRFYVWQKTKGMILRARGRALGGSIDPGHRVFETAIDDDLAHAWRITEVLLRRLRDDAAANGSRFVLAIVPCAEQVEDDVWQELVTQAGPRKLDRERPERALVEMAARHGITVVPMAEAFRQASGDLFLNHRDHLNDAGHERVAEELHAAIRGLVK